MFLAVDRQHGYTIFHFSPVDVIGCKCVHGNFVWGLLPILPCLLIIIVAVLCARFLLFATLFVCALNQIHHNNIFSISSAQRGNIKYESPYTRSIYVSGIREREREEDGKRE